MLYPAELRGLKLLPVYVKMSPPSSTLKRAKKVE
uniref:Uncharacterized protein n=1 Tax=Magnetococcus massalia (strain MO-1) TaxID=451514 RepID=A0A1S7LNE2_MAGMO|nr:protein of unknown function [Candidatus Magnetococcus massalia]